MDYRLDSRKCGLKKCQTGGVKNEQLPRWLPVNVTLDLLSIAIAMWLKADSSRAVSYRTMAATKLRIENTSARN